MFESNVTIPALPLGYFSTRVGNDDKIECTVLSMNPLAIDPYETSIKKRKHGSY
jgi:hypothetical protein